MIFTLGSVGLPGTSGFVGEILVLIGVWKVKPIVMLFAGSSLILGAVYMLRFYRKIAFGKFNQKNNMEFNDINIR